MFLRRILEEEPQLIEAIAIDCVTDIKLFLDGINLVGVRKNYVNATLIEAIKNNKWKIFRYLLANHSNLIDIYTFHNDCAIRVAIHLDRQQMCYELLQKNLISDKKICYSQPRHDMLGSKEVGEFYDLTALGYAVYEGRLNIWQILASYFNVSSLNHLIVGKCINQSIDFDNYGVALFLGDDDDPCPMHVDTTSLDLKTLVMSVNLAPACVAVLNTHLPRVRNAFLAIQKNDFAELKLICYGGISFLSVSSHENFTSLLHAACQLGSEAIVKFLIIEYQKHGCRIDLPDKDGKTPAEIATENGHDAITELFIARALKIHRESEQEISSAAYRFQF